MMMYDVSMTVKVLRLCILTLSIIHARYFASTTQSGTLSVDSWVRWPAKPSYHRTVYLPTCLQEFIISAI